MTTLIKINNRVQKHDTITKQYNRAMHDIS